MLDYDEVIRASFSLVYIVCVRILHTHTHNYASCLMNPSRTHSSSLIGRFTPLIIVLIRNLKHEIT